MKKTFAFVLSLLCIFTIMPTAFAGGSDTTPPELISVSIDKTDYQVGDKIIFTVKASDDLSGLSGGIIDFGIGNHCFVGINLVLQSDGKTLIGECQTDVNNYKTGVYQISGVIIDDNAGNKAEYYLSSILKNRILPPDMALKFTVTNNIKTDWDGPVLQSITADKTDVNAGDAITLTAVATDATGLEQYVTGLSGPSNLRIDLLPVKDSPDLLRETVTIPSDFPDGTYTSNGGIISDTLRNVRFYSNTPDQYNEKTPSAACITIRVHGQSLPQKGVVRITDLKINADNAKLGDTIKFRIALNKGGNTIDSFSIGIAPKVWAEAYKTVGVGTNMTEVEDGVYEGTITVPPNWPSGDYVINSMMWFDAEQGVGSYPYYGTLYYGTIYSEQFPTFPVNPVFSGSDNTSVIVGSGVFDPLNGVTAGNSAEGDLTSKIEVSGNVDTNTPGVYLLKYQIPSSYKDKNYPDKQYYYYDFRWVGVSEVQPQAPSDGSETPVAVANDGLAVGASNNDVSIAKDNTNMGYTARLTDPGDYTLTNSGGTSGTGNIKAADVQTYAADNGAKAKVNVVIDNSGPSIKATWAKSSSGITVTINASDVSGVAETRYKSGECSLQDCKDNGAVFSGAFTVADYGKYTVYSRDNFGYETVNVININAPSSNTAYLGDVKISAGKLSKAFSKTTYNYKIYLGENEGSITLTPIKENNGAAMTINKKSVASLTLPVANGKSVKFTVKVSYGGKSKTYTFTATRAKSTDNSLTALSASSGTFDSPLTPGKFNYTLTLAEGTKNVKIYDTAAQFASASFKSKLITLKNDSPKTIKLIVKAQSGAKKTYVITVVSSASA